MTVTTMVGATGLQRIIAQGNSQDLYFTESKDDAMERLSSLEGARAPLGRKCLTLESLEWYLFAVRYLHCKDTI